jgi:hypothetical protein
LSGEQFNFKADNKAVKDAVNTELTISEFAEYFTMRSDSEFVTKVSLLTTKFGFQEKSTMLMYIFRCLI